MAVGINVPLINGVAYAHADINFVLLGTPIIGVTAIEYDAQQTIEPNYSTGHLATSVGFGNLVHTGTVTVTMEEFQRMLLLPGILDGRIQNLPFFDIGINFITRETPYVLQRHRLKRCKFKGPRMSSTNNNTQIEVPLELFIADISFQG